MPKPALSAAAANQRAVFQENGHTGSSHLGHRAGDAIR